MWRTVNICVKYFVYDCTVLCVNVVLYQILLFIRSACSSVRQLAHKGGALHQQRLLKISYLSHIAHSLHLHSFTGIMAS